MNDDFSKYFSKKTDAINYNDLQDSINEKVHQWIMTEAPEYVRTFYLTRPTSQIFESLFQMIDTNNNLPLLLAQMGIYGIRNLINMSIQSNTNNDHHEMRYSDVYQDHHEMRYSDVYQNHHEMRYSDVYQNHCGKHYILSILEPSLSLVIKDNYKNYISLNQLKIFLLALKLDPNVVILETMLSFNSYDNEDKGNPRKICHEMSWELFLAGSSMKTFWIDYFTLLGVQPEIINIENPKSLQFVEKIIQSYDVKIIKDYLKWNIIQDLGFYTDIDQYLIQFNPFRQIKSKWISLTYDIYRCEINQWLQNNSNSNLISRAELIIEQLKSTLRQYLSESSKIDTNIKMRFIGKLDQMQVFVGLNPEMNHCVNEHGEWIDIVLKNRQDTFDLLMNKINKNIPKILPYSDIEGLSQIEFNAYYDMYYNCIIIPFAMMNTFFITDDSDRHQNTPFHEDIGETFGGFGAIVGHEMMHAFDIFGADIDQNGYFRPVNIPLIQYQASKIINLYHSPLSTLGENMADVLGIKLSLMTVLKYYPDSDILAFARKWATIFKENESTDTLKMKYDVHTHGNERINNPFRLINAFYQIFNIQESDKMFLPANQRIDYFDL